MAHTSTHQGKRGTWDGVKLRWSRIWSGATQEALAVAAGVEETQISQWESGTEPSKRDLDKIVEGFNAIARKAGRVSDYVADEFYRGK